MKTASYLSWLLFLIHQIHTPVNCVNPRVVISACVQTAVWVEVFDNIPPFVNLNDCMPQAYVGDIVVFGLGLTCFGDPLPGDLEPFTVYTQQGEQYYPATDFQFECVCSGSAGTCSDALVATTSTSSTGPTPTIPMLTSLVKPRAVMSITDNSYNLLTTVYIGQNVKLNVDLETNFRTHFDIIGWTCHGNTYILIKNGCSVVSYFPTFTHPGQGQLTASFEMFRFVTSSLLRFHCTLKVCAGMCNNTLTCPSNMNEVAWGRRRRRRDATDLMTKETVEIIEASVDVRMGVRRQTNKNSGSGRLEEMKFENVLIGLIAFFIGHVT